MLDDPVVSASEITHPRAGTHRLDDAIATLMLGDIVIHTWDLARATGLDETLDQDVVHDMLVGMEPQSDRRYGLGIVRRRALVALRSPVALPRGRA